MAVGTSVFISKKIKSRCINAFHRNKILQLEMVEGSNLTLKIIKLKIVAVTFLSFSIHVDCFVHYFTVCFKQAWKMNLSLRLIIHKISFRLPFCYYKFLLIGQKFTFVVLEVYLENLFICLYWSSSVTGVVNWRES